MILDRRNPTVKTTAMSYQASTHPLSTTVKEKCGLATTQNRSALGKAPVNISVSSVARHYIHEIAKLEITPVTPFATQ